MALIFGNQEQYDKALKEHSWIGVPDLVVITDVPTRPLFSSIRKQDGPWPTGFAHPSRAHLKS